MKQKQEFQNKTNIEDRLLQMTHSATEHSQKITGKSLEFTNSLVDKSKKLRTPSPKMDKIGTTIGGLTGLAFVCGGIVQLFVGKSLWAVGTLSLGAVALLSNGLRYHKIKDKE